MKIDIVSDVVCPWCYVGKKNLEAAMAQRPDIAFEVQWFPYQLHPEAPSEGYPYWDTIVRKYGQERAELMFAHLAQAGKASGINFQLEQIERGANTLQAHRLLDLAWQRGLQNQLAEALFNAYFCAGQFIGDAATLSKIAIDIGLDAQEVENYLASDEGTERIKDQIEFARQNGVMSVPSFSFDGKFALSGGQAVDVFVKMIDRINNMAGAAVS